MSVGDSKNKPCALKSVSEGALGGDKGVCWQSQCKVVSLKSSLFRARTSLGPCMFA